MIAARNTCFLLNEGMALDVAYTGPEWPGPEGVEMQPGATIPLPLQAAGSFRYFPPQSPSYANPRITCRIWSNCILLQTADAPAATKAEFPSSRDETAIMGKQGCFKL